MKLLTTREISERYDVAHVTAKKWVKRGLFPHAQKIGRDWLTPESDLARFIPPKVGYPSGKKRKP